MNEKNRYIAFDRVKLDKAKIKKDDEDELVVEAILASEIVQKYADGMAYKPAEELEKAAWTADGRWVKMLSHPAEGTIQKVSDISGKVDNVHSVKNLIDYKTGRPNRRGIVGDVHFFKHSRGKEGVTPVPQGILEQVKSGDLVDVSIGFLYEKDQTKGVWAEGGNIAYDYVQRNLMIDHLAAPLAEGRCPSPYCGLGQDSTLQGPIYIGLDPWEEGEEYIRSGHKDPDGFDKGSLRTIGITEGIKAVVGCPSGSYEGGKCKVGMEVQSYLFSKSKFSVEQAKAWFSEHKGDSFDANQRLKEEKRKKMVDEETSKLPEGELLTKLLETYAEKDKLVTDAMAPYISVKGTPSADLYRKFEAIDLEVKLYRDAYSKRLTMQRDAKCPICDQIRKLGDVKSSEILVRSFGLDNVMLAFESDGREKPLDGEMEIKRAKELIKSLTE